MTENITTITKNELFVDAAYNPSIQTAAHVDENGFAVSSENASASLRKTQEFTSSSGGGTRITNNTYEFESLTSQRLTATPSSFHFEATTTVNMTLDSLVSVAHSGSFFMVSHIDVPTVFNLRRSLRFAVDQPTRLTIQLGGQSTNADASFKNLFSYLVLLGGSFGLADRVYLFNNSNYPAAGITPVFASGVRQGVSYQVMGSVGASGISMTFDLLPAIANTAPVLELRWILPHTLDCEIGPSAFGWDRVVAASATVTESVQLAAIPEPVVALLIASGMMLHLLAQRSRKAV